MNTRSRILGSIVIVALTAALLTGCEEKEEEGSAFPATVGASNGNVAIPNQPARIVSLSPTATEMLFAIGAGAQTVAVDDQSTIPKEAPRTQLSGFTPNAEAVIGYKPDLVVVSNDSNNLVASLQAVNIPVLVEPAATKLDDVYDQMIDLGIATGNKERALAKNDEMRDEIRNEVAEAKELRHGKPAPTYYHELDNTYYSVTSQSFIGNIYSMFGLRNIADSTSGGNAYPQLSAESVVSANPDMIFLADTKCCGQTPTTVSDRVGFANVNAVKTNSVYELDDDVASRWGPRVVEMVDDVFKAVRQYDDATKTLGASAEH